MTRETRKIGLEALAKKILSKRNQDELILVYPHVRADGDAYGSSFALVKAFAKLGIEAAVLAEEDLSNEMAYMRAESEFINWNELSEEEQNEFKQKVSLSIQVDSSEDDRLANRLGIFQDSPEYAIIDHHISSKDNGGLIFIDPEAGANVELVYTLILVLEEFTGKKLFDKDIALDIYTGLLTDTGSFSYDNTKAETLRIAAELLEYEINVAELNNHLFKEKPWDRLIAETKLIQHAKLSADKQIAYLSVSQEFMNANNITDADLENLPAVLRNIKGVIVSLVLRETKEGTARGNLRSTGPNDISVIARAHNGGGHLNAAGFTITASELEASDLDSIAQQIIAEIKHELGL